MDFGRMEVHIDYWYMLNCLNIHYYLCIQVYSLEQFQYSLVSMNILLVYLEFLYIDCMDHKAMVHMGFEAQQDLKCWNFQNNEVLNTKFICYLLSSILIQLINGSPVYLFSQVQIGLWFITVQREFCLAHGELSLHGFLHFWSTHDLSWSQSELV